MFKPGGMVLGENHIPLAKQLPSPHHEDGGVPRHISSVPDQLVLDGCLPATRISTSIYFKVRGQWHLEYRPEQVGLYTSDGKSRYGGDVHSDHERGYFKW